MKPCLRFGSKLFGFALFFAGSLAWGQSHNFTFENFNAEFNVKFMGFNIGSVKQTMRCEAQQCVLVNNATPPNWAKRFINESAIETITLSTKNNQLRWKSYHKDLTRRYTDRTAHIQVNLVANFVENLIHNPNKQLSWPGSNYAFDTISIVYALQFYSHKESLPPLILQDETEQLPLQFVEKNKPTKVNLAYKNQLSARFFHWKTADYDAKIWLIDELNHFPGRIEFHNKKADRRLQLVLKHAPDFF